MFYYSHSYILSYLSDLLRWTCVTAGWLLIGGFLLVAASVIGLFPKSLPRAAARRVLAAERRSAGLSTKDDENKIDDDLPTSFAGSLIVSCLFPWGSAPVASQEAWISSSRIWWRLRILVWLLLLRGSVFDPPTHQTAIIILMRGQGSVPNFRCR